MSLRLATRHPEGGHGPKRLVEKLEKVKKAQERTEISQADDYWQGCFSYALGLDAPSDPESGGFLSALSTVSAFTVSLQHTGMGKGRDGKHRGPWNRPCTLMSKRTLFWLLLCLGGPGQVLPPLEGEAWGASVFSSVNETLELCDAASEESNLSTSLMATVVGRRRPSC